jgi:hypothetical protein
LRSVIYGTGKWAQLLQIKLKSFGLQSILIGNNPLVADYNRIETSHIAMAHRHLPVFIASATKDHFADLTHCSMFYPSIVFVEKGFASSEEKEKAIEWSRKRNVPIYILSQYRYSKILDVIEPFKNDIVSILHDWTLDKGLISEWIHHIISIDNYIKNSKNEFYASNSGSYIIDNISSIRIGFSPIRDLKTIIKTKDETIVLKFGLTNSVHIKSTLGVDAYSCFENEDCLTSQLKDIITNTENLRLERL